MPDYIAHEETLEHGFVLEIVHDEDCHNNPREWDNLGTMVSWSDRYSVGDEQPRHGVGIWLYSLAIDLGIPHWQVAWLYREPEETVEILAELADWELEGRIEGAPRALLANIGQHCLILGLNVGRYQHGGLDVCSAEYAASRASETGFIYVTHKDIAKEYGAVTPDTIERATKLLTGEVEEYSDWATGNVYGYRLKSPPELDEDGEEIDDGEEIEAVWGFIGDYDDHCLPEAKSAARAAIRFWVKDKPSIPLPRDLALIPLNA